MIARATYPYEGRTVLVTGAGTGIGRATARAFLEQGACVAVLGRRPEPLREAVAGFDAERVQVLAADVTDADALEGAVAAVIQRFGRLDVVVANAGTSEPSHIDTFDDDAWERLRAVNLDAVVRLARLTVPPLRATHGNFVAISSIAGLRGDWGQVRLQHHEGGGEHACAEPRPRPRGRRSAGECHRARLHRLPAHSGTPRRPGVLRAPPRSRRPRPGRPARGHRASTIDTVTGFTTTRARRRPPPTQEGTPS